MFRSRVQIVQSHRILLPMLARLLRRTDLQMVTIAATIFHDFLCCTICCVCFGINGHNFVHERGSFNDVPNSFFILVT